MPQAFEGLPSSASSRPSSKPTVSLVACSLLTAVASLAKLLVFTFLGNVVAILLLIAPALGLQFLVKERTDDSHLIFVCDQVQAWLYWVSFNLIAKWVIHAAFEFVPRYVAFPKPLGRPQIDLSSRLDWWSP